MDEYYLGKFPQYYDAVEFKNIKSVRQAVYIDSQEPCEEINNFIATDQAVMTVQDIFRCKGREDEAIHLDIFLHSTNPLYIETVLSYLPGATIHYITNAPRKDRVKEFIINHFKNHTTLTKKYMKEQCELSNNTWKDYRKDPTFKKWLQQHDIISDKFKLCLKTE